MKLPFDIGRLSDEFLQEMVERIRIGGSPLTPDQKAAFLLSGELPEGAEYPEIMDPANWGHGTWTQALLFANTDNEHGPVSGPYAVMQPGGFAAKTFRGKSGG